MIIPSIAALQPYLTLFGTLMSVGTLGFVLNIVKLMSDAAHLREEVLQERVQKSKEDVERTEKWSEREKAALQKEVTALQSQLVSAGVTTSLQAKEADASLPTVMKAAIEKQTAELRVLLTGKQAPDTQIDQEAALQLGRGYLATGKWSSAAKYLGAYLAQNPADWETQFARGVAYANTRGGRETDLEALRSLNEALAFGADPISAMTDQIRARIFIYRGAILKRMERLDEAECDIRLGASIASGDYERADAEYNLACILALRGDKEQLLSLLRKAHTLVQRRYVHDAILARMDTYFKRYSTDAEFRSVLENII